MSETWALISDIHGNIDALEAVLEDMAQHDIDQVVVLGDIINYGGAPRECVERITAMADVLILGNHEYALLEETSQGMVGAAGAGLAYAAHALADCEAWQGLVSATSFPESAECMFRGVQLVHGSPRDPVREYVWPGNSQYFLPFNDRLDQRLAQILAARTSLHCLCGHTHIPAVLVPYEARRIFQGQGWSRHHTFVGPQTMFWVPDGNSILEGLSAYPAILNPGSVGQPRDGSPEASYALYDGDRLCFRRVAYDIAAAQARILALPIAPEIKRYLAERLSRGE
jgi:predicted phosphodiesterase